MGGGDMDVPLIVNMAGELCSMGWATLRFNYGGVGASRGVFTDGIQEPYDVEGAVNHLRTVPEVDPGDLGLAGWSFGSWMALLAVARGAAVSSIVAISPPLATVDWRLATAEIASSKVPRYYIVGSRDHFCPLEMLEEFTSSISALDTQSITVLPGADHFLFGRESEVIKLVAELL
jgi:alpha/beta superfamily hydrolase